MSGSSKPTGPRPTCPSRRHRWLSRRLYAASTASVSATSVKTVRRSLSMCRRERLVFSHIHLVKSLQPHPTVSIKPLDRPMDHWTDHWTLGPNMGQLNQPLDHWTDHWTIGPTIGPSKPSIGPLVRPLHHWTHHWNIGPTIGPSDRALDHWTDQDLWNHHWTIGPTIGPLDRPLDNWTKH